MKNALGTERHYKNVHFVVSAVFLSVHVQDVCVCVCVCVNLLQQSGLVCGYMSFFLCFIFWCCWFESLCLTFSVAVVAVRCCLYFGCCVGAFLCLHFWLFFAFSVSSFLVAVCGWCLSAPSFWSLCGAFLCLYFWWLCVPFLCLLASVCKKSVSVWVKGGKAWSCRSDTKKKQ